MITGIYKITSPSGKIYIGQSINIEERWEHYTYIHCNSQPKLYNSLIKYGWDKHIKEIIEECTLEQLNEKEIHWKQQYINELGWKNVLFCELYDKGGGPRSDETKEKIRKGKLGQRHTEDSLIKMRKPRVNTEKMKNSKSFIRTKESKSLQSKALMKPISQFDINNNFIQFWPSTKDAGDTLGLSRGSITRCLKGELKSIRKFKWEYTNE